MFGKLTKINGDDVTIHLDGQADMYRINKFADGKQPLIEIKINDQREITVLQRKRIYAMFAEISNWAGYSRDETKQVMKYDFIVKTGYPEFSLSDVSETIAKEFIEYLINFCFTFDVPYKMSTADLLHSNDYFQYQCILHRKCVICGKHAQIDHIYPIGMGRDRSKIDNTQFEFEALCPLHHQMKHQLNSPDKWIAKHHIVPIKLNREEIKRLHIGGYKDANI